MKNSRYTNQFVIINTPLSFSIILIVGGHLAIDRGWVWLFVSIACIALVCNAIKSLIDLFRNNRKFFVWFVILSMLTLIAPFTMSVNGVRPPIPGLWNIGLGIFFFIFVTRFYNLTSLARLGWTPALVIDEKKK